MVTRVMPQDQVSLVLLLCLVSIALRGRTLAATVNGPMLHRLAVRTEHLDVECVELFRTGAELYSESIRHLWPQCFESNKQLAKCLKEDRNSAELHALALKDAALGRMSRPVPADEVDLNQVPGMYLRVVLPLCVLLIHVEGAIGASFRD